MALFLIMILCKYVQIKIDQNKGCDYYAGPHHDVIISL